MYYSAEDYQVVDKMALRLRIDYGHFEKCLDVFQLAKQLNMNLIKYSSLTVEQLKKISKYNELKDGFTIISKKKTEYKFSTYYNDRQSSARIRLTIAHEIKHVVFQEINPSDKDEDLANHFARYILAPTCLVMPYINSGLTEAEIIDDFYVSEEAAGNAYRHAFNRLYFLKDRLNDFEKEFIDEFTNFYRKKDAARNSLSFG